MSTPAEAPLLQRIPREGQLEPDAILDLFTDWVDERGLTLYPAQEEALLELLGGRHLILGTPTGSGKSLVAEGLHFKAMCEGQRSFYTSPVKALASQKFFSLCDDFGPENVGMLTGDASINSEAPIICCTAEVLANMVLGMGDALSAPYVIMDEFHYYSDRGRGWAWQVPLLELPRTTFLLMSATLGDTSSLRERIRTATEREVAVVDSGGRPVPLDYDYRETPISETIEALLEAAKAPIYIVHFTQREAADQAQGLTGANICSRDDRREIQELLKEFRFDSPYGKEIKRLLGFGVGLHHAGLLPKYRLLVEQLAQRGLLRVICGTDTLGVGVNIPIRTVLFSKLSKYDGEKVALLSSRDFHQIAGRAGRKGFDDRGSVVCQAPEHIVEKRRAERRSGSEKEARRRSGKIKTPGRGFVPWNRDTFERLIQRPPETLVSVFRLNHGMLLNVLQREASASAAGPAYRAVLGLVDRCHEGEPSRARLRRSAAVLFRSLRGAELIRLETDRERGGWRIVLNSELQIEFSMHRTLSLYLVEALAALDPDSPTYALEILSLVEAIQEHPHAILYQQLERIKRELLARLKAAGVPYEERVQRMEEVSHPAPDAEFIYETFRLFAEHHPWVGAESIHPKSIAREIYEGYYTFDGYVRHCNLARSEGVLLRYLSQVYGTLAQSVPEAHRSQAVYDLLVFFREMLVRADSSLVQEWESLLHPEPQVSPSPTREHPMELDLAAHPKLLLSRVRGEMHRLVQALAERDYAAAAARVCPESDDPWDATRFEQAMAEFYDQYEELVFTPKARVGDTTVINAEGPRRWSVQQKLLDPEEDDLWAIVGEVDLRERRNPSEPLVCMIRIGT